jgi:ATP-dependent DNA helicase RecQ
VKAVDARSALKAIFGYDDFRPGQAEIIDWILAGEDVFAVMPTGSGKSMCYQLPAILDGGLTLVVSPLIALMRDQVRQLAALGVAAATLNTMSADSELDEAWRLLDAGELRLLFLSPERLANDRLVERLRRAGVRRLAIDEAHCVSQWGHDFRPEYRRLADVREALGKIQVVAFTATADKATQDDIVAQLFSRPPRILLHSFDRPNIALNFAPKDKPRSQIDAFLTRHHGESGIIYAASRARTEVLAASLSKKGHRALAYHAGLDHAVRSRNQDVFLGEDGVVIVATVAFGMGINKPDVRFVVHADMPAGIENYYQEIGRAGRDDLAADTLTLYGLDDMAVRRRQLAEKELSPEQRRVEQRRLSAMLDLCELATCRRQALLAYFGESAEACGSCDLCRNGTALYDATTDAQKALSAAARTGERFGAGHLADLLIGETTETIRRHGHDGLKTFGAGKDRGRRDWIGTVRQLFAAGALEDASAEHGGFRLTPHGEDILFGRQSITLRVLPPATRRDRETRRREAGAAKDTLEPSASALFEQLRKLRTTLAKAEGIAAYMVFADRTLVEMAERRPASDVAMKALHGVGERKLQRYGAIFLAEIDAFLSRQNV